MIPACVSVQGGSWSGHFSHSLDILGFAVEPGVRVGGDGYQRQGPAGDDDRPHLNIQPNSLFTSTVLTLYCSLA